ncbi:MAG: hypothetical protein NC343_06315 [Muribaculum sp.]|nr:hypothetical protein [Muribaculaceae bacterium]MCM1081347.1 hypothetical protein [Muribaculum sp.]
MKFKILALIIVILSATSTIFAAESANKAVEKIAEFITGQRSATIRFVPAPDGEQQQQQIICIMGDKFKINSRQLAVWYDGRTQWTYLAQNKEVSITEPSPEELAEINPLLILGTLQSHYNARYLSNKGDYPIIELTPKAGAESVLPICKLIIKYKKNDYSPVSLRVEFDAGNTLDVNINSITRGINYPHSTFVFNKEQFPSAEIVDLR